VPLVSGVYNGLRQVIRSLDQQPFVTRTCRDVETQRVILRVYVPTTSGYCLLVPE
jgi:hypothetical protein